jgi:hypothetical protein
MRSFKIKALSVSGRGKKIFRARETAHENELPAGAIDKLIAGGYIEEIKPDPAAEKAKAKAEKAKAEAEAAEQVKADEEAKLAAEKAEKEAAEQAEAADELPEKNTQDGQSEKSTPVAPKNGKK